MNGDVVAPIPRHNSQRDSVPDAAEWSIDDVVKFFADLGYDEQAEVFREQVIIYHQTAWSYTNIPVASQLV